MPPPVTTIHHRKATASEGRSVLLVVAFTIIGLGVFQWFLFPWIWESSKFFVVASFAVEAAVMTIAIYYAVSNIRAGGTFECRLDDDEIACRCPVKGAGENFTVPLADIVKLESEQWDSKCRWYIWDRTGRRFWLTSNYDNPVEEIVGAIRTRIPELIEFRS